MRPRQTTVLLLAGLLLAACQAVLAQQAQSRRAGDGDPAFVSDAQALTDLESSGFLSPADAADDLFGNGNKTDGSADSTFGLVTDGNYTRLKSAGQAISAYEPEPIASSGAIGLACSFGFVDEDFVGTYVGVGSSAFSKGYACGRCLRIQCDDKFCSEPGRSILAQVVDLCGDCVDSSIAIARPAFLNLTGREADTNPSVEVSWKWVDDCGGLKNGNIKMLVKPGGNAYFQAFNFANSIVPITAVQVNGQRLKFSTSNFWEWNPGQAINPRGPFNMALLGSNREVLRVRFNQLRSQDLGVQFKATA